MSATPRLLLSDGSVEALAIGRCWIGSGLAGELLEIPDAAERRETMRAASAAGREVIDLAAAVGASVLARVREELAALDPFLARLEGGDRLSAARKVDPELEQALAAALGRTPEVVRRPGRRGRPPGSDPFRGVNLEVLAMALLHPGEPMAERVLAKRLRRATSAIHRARKVLVQLRLLGEELEAAPGSLSRVMDAWRFRFGAGRRRAGWLRQDEREARQLLTEVAERHPGGVLLTGSAAAAVGAQLAGEPLTAFLTDEALEHLRARGEVLPRGRVRLLPIEEPVVLVEPVGRGPVYCTNRLVTALELQAGGTDRGRDAALLHWESSGG